MPYTTPLGYFDTSATDGQLGYEVSITNDRPPLGSFVFGPAFDGTCFIIKSNRLYSSKPKRPEAWPQLSYVEVGTPQHPGITGVFHNGQPHYFTKHNIYYIQGTGQGLFQPIRLEAKTGSQSPQGALSIAGTGIFHVGTDGLYLFANQSDRKITEDTIEPLFRGETVNGMPGIKDLSRCWLHHYKGRIYFGYASAENEHPKHVICLNLQNKKVSYFEYNEDDPWQIRAVETDDTYDRLLIGDNQGYLRVIEDKSATTDSGAAISWEVQSKDYTLSTRKHFPRWVKYDINAENADSVSGKLLLDGSVHQTHVVTGNRQTKRRLVGSGNGDKAAVRISGTGNATIYNIEFE